MKYVGYLLLAILAVVVVLLLVAVINAVRIKAKPIKGKETLDYTPNEEKTYAEKLCVLLICHISFILQEKYYIRSFSNETPCLSIPRLATHE